MKMSLTRGIVSAALLLCLSDCGWTDRQFVAQARIHVKHVVVIIQENRSFDNLFQGFPGADTRAYGYAHDGTRVPLKPVSLGVGYDISNGFADFVKSFDNGKMDGWDLREITPVKGVPFSVAQYPQFGYVPHSESKLYFEMAHQYVLADRMFQSNIDLSFAAHLYLIAGQAGRAANVPTGRPWGCDAYYGTTVLTLNNRRQIDKAVFPCFDFPTLGDELTSAHLSWTYYAPRLDTPATWKRFEKLPEGAFGKNTPDIGQLWTSYDAVAHDRYGPAWSTNIESPQTRILTDVANGKLASVTWVVPSWRDSDHSNARSTTGPQWVASIINAVGKSRFWDSTVIFVLWDDSGGWYDHVPPPQLDYDGLGIRIPLLVISPFAKRGHVSHVQYEAAGIVKFIEQVFSLSALSTADHRANSLADCFDFFQAPRPFTPFGNVNPLVFLRERPSRHPPDND